MGYLAPVSDHRMLTTFRGELWDTLSALYSEHQKSLNIRTPLQNGVVTI